MNDDFLKGYRKRPDPEFAEALYQRIHQEKWSAAVMKRITLALATLSVLLAAVFATSPAARAAALAVIRKIGGVRVHETTEYPGSGERRQAAALGETLSLEEARASFPGPISLPAYLPEGYEFQSQVQWFPVDKKKKHPQVALQWIRQDERMMGTLYLSATYIPEGAPERSLVVGEGAVEEVEINDRLAVLARGAWNSQNGNYDPDSGLLVLSWKYDENTIYSLTSADPEMTLGELLATAESIP